MKVHLDGIVFSLQRHGGITVYFRELLQRTDKADVQFVLSLETPLAQPEPPSAGTGGAVVAQPARLAERYRRCRALATTKADLFHSTYYRLPAQRQLATVVTVHDFAYERCTRGPRSWLHSAQKRAAIRHAQAIICISQTTRDDLLELVGLRSGQQLHVVYNGVSPSFAPLPTRLPNEAAAFVLFVGQRSGYKNFRLAGLALEHLPDIELHCVGGGPLQPSEVAHLSEPTRSRIKHRGYVSDEQLNRLYNDAGCLLYPSAYEGFGIPVVEAMRAGCPVVSIRCKAVLEIGRGALTVAESDPRSLADAIASTLQPALRAELQTRGFAIAQEFGWDRHADETLGVYKSVFG